MTPCPHGITVCEACTAEVAELKEEVRRLRAEVRKQVFGSRVVFDREVVERAEAALTQESDG